MVHDPRVRSEISDFKPYSPGLSVEEIKYRYGLSRVIKMASNENPLGTSPRVLKAIKKYAPYAFRYPRPGCPELTKNIARQLDVPRECIIVGNGSDEVIDLLLRTKPRPYSDNVVVFDPSFSIYSLQAKLCGLQIRRVPINTDFTFPWDNLLQVVDENTSFVFVTTPDNPSGFAPSLEEIIKTARKLPESALLVLDEAYMDFAQDPGQHSALTQWSHLENVVVLRTFSKAYGLAGLRLGYGLMPAWLAKYMLRVKLPFSVNILAEKAGLTALEDRDFYRITLDTVARGRRVLSRELRSLNCQVYPSQSNFLLFKPPIKAGTVFENLLARGIIIRPLDSYGLPQYLRVSIGKEEENEEFIANLEDILSRNV